MSITFREFVEIVEGKKKDRKRLKSAFMAGQQQAEPKVVNIPAGEPNSPERDAAIKKLMRASGGGAVRKAIKEKEKKAEKAAKNILNQEGFSYGSKSFQQELEKQREEAKKRIKKEAEQRNNVARNAFRREGGMISYEKGPDGKVVRGRRTKDGFTPDP
jgi:hypothetical protein